jgi:ATP-dependent helicase/nuclease subunit A
MAVFKIFGSSAGSGKTFTLTKSFLALVLAEEDPRYFKRILAITFTNDAANEMKGRILETLKELAQPDANSKMLASLQLELPHLSLMEISQRASKIFLEIIHNYSDFAVKTIDSFINQIVNSFSFDLNISQNYAIRLDQDVVLKEAVDKLLEKIGKPDQEALTELLSDFSLDKIEQEKNWNKMAEELAQFANVLLDDDKLAQLSRNQHLDFQDFQQIKNQIKAANKQILAEIKAFAAKGLALIEKSGLSCDDFSYGKSGVFGLYQKLYDSPEDIILKAGEYPKARHVDAFENNVWYAKKLKNTDIGHQIDAITPQLLAIGLELCSFKEASGKYLALKQIDGSLLKMALLFLIKEELQNLMKSRNEVFLAEFNRWILQIVMAEPVPFIYERIGEKFNHLLIDEFQDTSNAQFFNLLPLIDNSLSKDFFSMLVGDPKQSVYSWRGGNIQLMIDLMTQNEAGLKANPISSAVLNGQIDNLMAYTSTENLQNNYRSQPEIVAFNNSFFKFLSENLQAKYPYVAKVFEDVAQFSPSTPKSAGHVEISFVPFEKGEHLVLTQLQPLIANLITKGYSSGDIAILCRKNKEATLVANFIQELGYEVNSSDSLKVIYNTEVDFLVALLSLVHSPESRFLKFEVLQFFRKIKVDDFSKSQNIAELISADMGAFFHAIHLGLDLDKILDMDYYFLTEYFIEVFDLKQNLAALPYLSTFSDIVLNYYHKESKMLGDFLEYWEITKHKVNIQNKSKDAITVTTIHKSKGLEYPVVILPFVNWSTELNIQAELWLDVSFLEYEELKVANGKLQSAPFRFDRGDKMPLLASQMKHYDELNYIENLNMLYVAFTRPVEAMYIFSPFDHWQNVKGIGGLLKEYLENSGQFEPHKLTYLLHEGIGKVESHVSFTPVEIFEVPKFGVATQSNALKIKADALMMPIDISKKVEMGTVIHAAFERIKTEEDVWPTLNQIKHEGWFSSEKFDDFTQKVWAVVQHPLLEGLFWGGHEILTETDILGNEQAAARPDRVVFTASEVFIVDYKTGEKNASHKVQLKKYGQLFVAMGYENIHLLLVYLDPLEVVRV